MWSIAYGGVFFVAWLIARVVTGWLRQWALSRGVVDRPDKMRKQHAAATPLLGGVAIAVAFNVTVVLGLGPVKGIPLPLLSYGRSSIICTLLAVGILLHISQRKAYEGNR